MLFGGIARLHRPPSNGCPGSWLLPYCTVAIGRIFHRDDAALSCQRAQAKLKRIARSCCYDDLVRRCIDAAPRRQVRRYRLPQPPMAEPFYASSHGFGGLPCRARHMFRPCRMRKQSHVRNARQAGFCHRFGGTVSIRIGLPPRIKGIESIRITHIAGKVSAALARFDIALCRQLFVGLNHRGARDTQFLGQISGSPAISYPVPPGATRCVEKGQQKSAPPTAAERRKQDERGVERAGQIGMAIIFRIGSYYPTNTEGIRAKND